MTLSNHERIGKGLDALKRGLGPYVLREMKRHYGDRLETLLEKTLYDSQLARIRQGDGVHKAFLEAVDVDALLKLMRDYYRQVFFDKLGHSARNYVHEATTARHSWAHQHSFTAEGAARDLETMMLLLKAVGAAEEAEEVARHMHAVRRGDRYETVRLLGKGGMAEVYLARDKELDRDVALKYLNSQYAADPDFVQRFDREAKSAASLSHPNIVSVYDRGQTEDTHYIVMEYVSGDTLKAYVRSNGRLSAKAAAEVAAQIGDALDAAHRQGVIHRDIKPQNILVTETGGVKVTDFGIARAASHSTITHTGQVLGSAHYFAPEQAEGGSADSRSDLYSLGVVLYEMLTGKLPYDADTPVGVMMQHINGQLRPPIEIDSEIPKCINALTVKLLSRKPEERHQSAAKLLDDLEKITDGKDPVTDVTEPLPDRNREETEHTRPMLAEIVVSSHPGERFQSIRQALREIQPGGSIRVRPGVYRESLVIDKPVEIIGEQGPDGDVVIESAEGPCLSISAGKGLLKGLVLRRLEHTEEQAGKGSTAVTISAGQVMIEGCDITSAVGDCVKVHGSEANPTIRRCKIHDGKRRGVWVKDDGCGLVEDCEIFGNASPGVSITRAANPTIRSCKIYYGKNNGILVSSNGEGLVEDCEIFWNVLQGVSIERNSNLTIRSCKIYEGRQSGVWVYDNGGGVVEDCEIFGNACSGIRIQTVTSLHLSLCTITRNRHEAVRVSGRGTIVSHENCNLEGNLGGPWSINGGAKVYGVYDS